MSFVFILLSGLLHTMKDLLHCTLLHVQRGLSVVFLPFGDRLVFPCSVH